MHHVLWSVVVHCPNMHVIVTAYSPQKGKPIMCSYMNLLDSDKHMILSILNAQTVPTNHTQEFVSIFEICWVNNLGSISMITQLKWCIQKVSIVSINAICITLNQSAPFFSKDSVVHEEHIQVITFAIKMQTCLLIPGYQAIMHIMAYENKQKGNIKKISKCKQESIPSLKTMLYITITTTNICLKKYEVR